MQAKKAKSIAGKFIKTLLTIVLVLIIIFFIGRYGWKLCGFSICQSAGIDSVEVTDGQVRITGFEPGSFPTGFLGYHAEEVDGKLYVGFKFSAVFGIFEINEVIIKTGREEYSVWNELDGWLPPSERYGVYVKLEPMDVYGINFSYDGESGGVLNADNTAMESGEYILIENEIAQAAKEMDKPVPFTLEITREDGSIFAKGDFVYDLNREKIYLTVTADGQIIDDTISRIPAPTESNTAMEAYAVVIGEYYTALAEAWDGQQLMDAGLNYMVADYHHGTPLEDVGYAVTDLDEDGTAELLLGARVEDDLTGKMIFALYTRDKDGAPMLLFESQERNRYYYAGGFKFANLGSNSWNESYETTLKLEDKEMIDMTYTTDPADYVQMELVPFSQWVE